MFALHHASCCSIAVKGKSCPACKSLCFQGGFEKEWKGLHIGLQAHFSFPFSFLLCYTPLMVKESGPPKAINIIRPTHSLSSRRRHAAPAELTESRKPKVASAAKISISSTNKHQLNIFHPPSRPQHHQQQQPQKQPGSYEIYRPRSNLSRSLTTPSVSSSSSSSAAATARRPHYIPPTSASHNIISNTAPRPLTRSKTIVPAVSDASSSSSSKNAQASDSETTLRSSSNSGGGSSEDEDDDDDDSEDDKKQQGQSDDNEVEDDEISEARVNRKVKTLPFSSLSITESYTVFANIDCRFGDIQQVTACCK